MKWQRRPEPGTGSCLATVTASGAVDLYSLQEKELRKQHRLHVAEDQLALSLDWNDGVSTRCAQGLVAHCRALSRCPLPAVLCPLSLAPLSRTFAFCLWPTLGSPLFQTIFALAFFSLVPFPLIPMLFLSLLRSRPRPLVLAPFFSAPTPTPHSPFPLVSIRQCAATHCRQRSDGRHFRVASRRKQVCFTEKGAEAGRNLPRPHPLTQPVYPFPSLTSINSWHAHDFPAWITAYDYWQPTTIFSGTYAERERP